MYVSLCQQKQKYSHTTDYVCDSHIYIHAHKHMNVCAQTYSHTRCVHISVCVCLCLLIMIWQYFSLWFCVYRTLDKSNVKGTPSGKDTNRSFLQCHCGSTSSIVRIYFSSCIRFVMYKEYTYLINTILCTLNTRRTSLIIICET